MRFQDAAPDARHVVYAGIQADALVGRVAALLADATTGERIMARAVMNGERTDPGTWRAMFPTLFGPTPAPGPEGAGIGARAVAARGTGDAARAEAIEAGTGHGPHPEALLAACLQVAERGEQARSQYRGAIVESVTEILLRRRTPAVRRERRILFDGVRAEIHPYDVTVEAEGAAEAWDCKWGARGINADVLDQLDDARRHAVDEGGRLRASLVVFDARRSCLVRLARQTVRREGIGLVTLETLDRLAGWPASAAAQPAPAEAPR